MRGPQGKGHAEMAVTKLKDSGVETPTSEPGYSITDYEWEDADVSKAHNLPNNVMSLLYVYFKVKL